MSPAVSDPLGKGGVVIIVNYRDHTENGEPHVHVRYQGDTGYRIEIRTRRWLKSNKSLPNTPKKLVEQWVCAHETELLREWKNARLGRPVKKIEI